MPREESVRMFASKAQMRKWMRGWRWINEFTRRERLRRPLAERYRNLLQLHAFWRSLDHSPRECEEIEEVRKRWLRVRKKNGAGT
jgi:hypothetical protein